MRGNWGCNLQQFSLINLLNLWSPVKTDYNNFPELKLRFSRRTLYSANGPKPPNYSVYCNLRLEKMNDSSIIKIVADYFSIHQPMN